MLTKFYIPTVTSNEKDCRIQYIIWCYRNLYVLGEPKPWKTTANMLIFKDTEDATAFRLKFGL